MQDNLNKLLNKHDIILSDNELASIDTNNTEKTLKLLMKVICKPLSNYPMMQNKVWFKKARTVSNLNSIVDYIHFLIDLNESNLTFEQYALVLAIKKYDSCRHYGKANPIESILAKTDNFPRIVNNVTIMGMVMTSECNLDAHEMLSLITDVYKIYKIFRHRYQHLVARTVEN